MTTLTQCQQQVLDMLISYQKERGFPPTNQEVATMLGYQPYINDFLLLAFKRNNLKAI